VSSELEFTDAKEQKKNHLSKTFKGRGKASGAREKSERPSDKDICKKQKGGVGLSKGGKNQRGQKKRKRPTEAAGKKRGSKQKITEKTSKKEIKAKTRTRLEVGNRPRDRKNEGGPVVKNEKKRSLLT